MSEFPRKEADIVALVQSMVAGYTAHAVDFPSADPIGNVWLEVKHRSATTVRLWSQMVIKDD